MTQRWHWPVLCALLCAGCGADTECRALSWECVNCRMEKTVTCDCVKICEGDAEVAL